MRGLSRERRGVRMTSLPVPGFLLVMWAAAVFAFLLRVDRLKLIVLVLVLTVIMVVLLWRGHTASPTAKPMVLVLRSAGMRLVS